MIQARRILFHMPGNQISKQSKLTENRTAENESAPYIAASPYVCSCPLMENTLELSDGGFPLLLAVAAKERCVAVNAFINKFIFY